MNSASRKKSPSTSSNTSKKTEQPPFEKIVARVTEIVEQLEQGELSLEQSLAAFEEGVHLTRMGAKQLQEAEQRIEQLMEKEGELFTEPLENEETDVS